MRYRRAKKPKSLPPSHPKKKPSLFFRALSAVFQAIWMAILMAFLLCVLIAAFLAWHLGPIWLFRKMLWATEDVSDGSHPYWIYLVGIPAVLFLWFLGRVFYKIYGPGGQNDSK